MCGWRLLVVYRLFYGRLVPTPASYFKRIISFTDFVALLFDFSVFRECISRGRWTVSGNSRSFPSKVAAGACPRLFSNVWLSFRLTYHTYIFTTAFWDAFLDTVACLWRTRRECVEEFSRDTALVSHDACQQSRNSTNFVKSNIFSLRRRNWINQNKPWIQKFTHWSIQNHLEFSFCSFACCATSSLSAFVLRIQTSCYTTK